MLSIGVYKLGVLRPGLSSIISKGPNFQKLVSSLHIVVFSEVLLLELCFVVLYMFLRNEFLDLTLIIDIKELGLLDIVSFDVRLVHNVLIKSTLVLRDINLGHI